jgi:hypothetical protein
MRQKSVRQIIIIYYSNHPGRTAQQAMDEDVDDSSIRNNASRRIFFRELKVLKKQGVIVEKPINKRDKGLVVERSNLLVRVPKTLSRMRSVVKTLLENSINAYKARSKRTFNRDDDSSEFIELLADDFARDDQIRACFRLYSALSKVLLLHLTVLWPSQVSKDVLRELGQVITTHLSDMQIEMSNMIEKELNKAFLDNIRRTQVKAIGLVKPDDLLREFESAEDLKMEKSVEPVLGLIWQLSFPFQTYQINRLPSDYENARNWREFA